uniref:Triabin-like protein 2 n=1 Tax=Pristhesancus plagipennis TaxID=1955184 RepID=A0A1Q1NP38_PRIPG|nr:triabin-like protein 2 [Pristhesancus plagipennis]
MTTIFTLTFLGVLALSWSAAPPPEKVCRNLHAKADLDLKKFYSGKWYLTNIEQSSVPAHPCQETHNEVKEDGTIEHMILDFDKSRTPAKTHLNCVTNMKDVKDHKPNFTCKFKESPETWTSQSIGTVLETDYDNFAVYHVCSKMDEMVLGENILVMHRNKDADPSNPKISETLKSLGLNLDSFTSRKSKANCVYDSD